MKPYYEDASVTLWHGDCLDVLRSLPGASVDAVVTDPPYGLGFMGQKWDTYANEVGRAPAAGAKFDHVGGNHNPSNAADAARTRRVESRKFGDWCESWTAECLRVLKPGGHMLAFGGTRTWHRLACAVEEAGFEVRDSIAWLYGSGFPKSLDVSKAIDKAAGAEREVVGDKLDRPGYHLSGHDSGTGALGRGISSTTPETRLASALITAPATPDAERWQGWGTALKPAFEPVVVARRPLSGTVAANVLEHGTGALNIDGCRLGGGQDYRDKCASVVGLDSNRNGDAYGEWVGIRQDSAHAAGRWPANVVLDESQAEVLDEQSGESQARIGKPRGADHGDGWGMTATGAEYDDTGGASRFFYVAKAGASERPRVNGTAHPTVKPLDLMRWLVRLVTPPGGTVLEPFAGSGTTVEACIVEGFHCIAIEREADYLPLITQRINRRRNPVAYIEAAGEDLGLFNLEGEPA